MQGGRHAVVRAWRGTVGHGLARVRGGLDDDGTADRSIVGMVVGVIGHPYDVRGGYGHGRRGVDARSVQGWRVVVRLGGVDR